MYFTLTLDLSLSICQLQEYWTVAATVSNVSRGKIEKKEEDVRMRASHLSKLSDLINSILASSKLFPSDNQMSV